MSISKFILKYFSLPLITLIPTTTTNAQDDSLKNNYYITKKEIRGEYHYNSSPYFSLELKRFNRFKLSGIFKPIYDSTRSNFFDYSMKGKWKIHQDTLFLHLGNRYSTDSVKGKRYEKKDSISSDLIMVKLKVPYDYNKFPDSLILTKYGFQHTYSTTNDTTGYIFKPELWPGFGEELIEYGQAVFMVGVQGGFKNILGELNVGIGTHAYDHGYEDISYITLGTEFSFDQNLEVIGFKASYGVSMIFIAYRASFIYYTNFSQDIFCITPQFGFTVNSYVDLMLGFNFRLNKRNDLCEDINFIHLSLSLPLVNRT